MKFTHECFALFAVLELERRNLLANFMFMENDDVVSKVGSSDCIPWSPLSST